MAGHVVCSQLGLQRAPASRLRSRQPARCSPSRQLTHKSFAVLGPETAVAVSTAASAAGMVAAAATTFTAGPAQAAVFQLAELTPQTAALIASLGGPFLSIAELAFILRIVMSWYPDVKDTELPWSIIYIPTEPLLAPTRRFISPVGGVDVTPVVWFALLSFLNEILLGRQGLLVLLSEKAPVVL